MIQIRNKMYKENGNNTICPKCGKEMQIGALGPIQRGELFWADNTYFQSKICNFMTIKGAERNGAIRIPVGNGITNNRTKAWACTECRMVLVDCK